MYSLNVFSQDFIILKTGEEIKSKVLEYDEFYVRYRLFDDLSGNILSERKSNVLLIKYNDGATIVFDNKEDNVSTNDSSIVQISSKQKAQIAQSDAQKHYAPIGPVVFSGCASFCVPGIGILTALTPPKIENYNMPKEYSYDEEYIYYYGKEAEKIKKNKVLLMTAISTSASLLFWLLIFSGI